MPDEPPGNAPGNAPDGDPADYRDEASPGAILTDLDDTFPGGGPGGSTGTQPPHAPGITAPDDRMTTRVGADDESVIPGQQGAAAADGGPAVYPVTHQGR